MTHVVKVLDQTEPTPIILRESAFHEMMPEILAGVQQIRLVTHVIQIPIPLMFCNLTHVQ